MRPVGGSLCLTHAQLSRGVHYSGCIFPHRRPMIRVHTPEDNCLRRSDHWDQAKHGFRSDSSAISTGEGWCRSGRFSELSLHHLLYFGCREQKKEHGTILRSAACLRSSCDQEARGVVYRWSAVQFRAKKNTRLCTSQEGAVNRTVYDFVPIVSYFTRQSVAISRASRHRHAICLNTNWSPPEYTVVWLGGVCCPPWHCVGWTRNLPPR